MAAADMDMSATMWPRVRLTYKGNNGSDITNTNDGNYGDDVYMNRVGTKLSGTLLHGVEYHEYPQYVYQARITDTQYL